MTDEVTGKNMGDYFEDTQSGSGNKRSPLFLVMLVLGILTILVVVFALMGGGGGSAIFGGSSSSIDPVQFTRVQSEFVLRPEDFTTAYFFMPGGESSMGNREISQTVGALTGKQYISETGRVDGWESGLAKGNDNDFGPATYLSNVQVFETVDGASTAITLDWFWSTDDERAPDVVTNSSCSLGNDCELRSFESFYVESGLTKVRHEVLFRYKNVLAWVSVRGLDVETRPEDALSSAAQLILDELETIK